MHVKYSGASIRPGACVRGLRYSGDRRTLMRHPVRVPRVYAPRSSLELHEIGKRLGGEVWLVFVPAARDASGKVISQGYLDHLVLEFEDEGTAASRPIPHQTSLSTA